MSDNTDLEQKVILRLGIEKIIDYYRATNCREFNKEALKERHIFYDIALETLKELEKFDKK